MPENGQNYHGYWSIILKIILWAPYTLTHAVLRQSAIFFGKIPILGHPITEPYSTFWSLNQRGQVVCGGHWRPLRQSVSRVRRRDLRLHQNVSTLISFIEKESSLQ